MTHIDLITAIYGNYVKLLTYWNSHVKSEEDVSAFVFFPDGYSEARNFDQVLCEFWSLPKIQLYLEKGGQTDRAMTDLLKDLNLAEEFPVMIIEHGRYEHRQLAHIYRITKAGLR
jgi:hypothetical protein